MKKQTTKKQTKKPATVTAKTVGRRRGGSTTAQPRASAKRNTALRSAERTVNGGGFKPLPVAHPTPTPATVTTHITPPPPAAAAPKYSAPWRSGIDWVAAGRKAYETRLRNLAARQAEDPSVAANIAAHHAHRDAKVDAHLAKPMAALAQSLKRQKAPKAKPAAAALSEGDIHSGAKRR